MYLESTKILCTWKSVFDRQKKVNTKMFSAKEVEMSFVVR